MTLVVRRNQGHQPARRPRRGLLAHRRGAEPRRPHERDLNRQLAVGDRVVHKEFPPISRHTLALYRGASGDHNPIHIDLDFAKAAGYPDVFAHGMLVHGLPRPGADRRGPSPAAAHAFDARFVAITQLGATPDLRGPCHRARSNTTASAARALALTHQGRERRRQACRRSASSTSPSDIDRKDTRNGQARRERSRSITGSGRGIGRAIALKLASEGAQRRRQRPRCRAGRRRGRRDQGGGRRGHRGATAASPNRASPSASSTPPPIQFGGLDIIVNNAGYTWDSTIQKMTRRAVPGHARRPPHGPVPDPARALPSRSGSWPKKEAEAGREVFRKVVNISSIAGLYGNAGQANYSSAKASA